MSEQRRGNLVSGWWIITPTCAFREASHLGLINVSEHLNWVWYLTDGAQWELPWVRALRSAA